jgi:hypothetical protein
MIGRKGTQAMPLLMHMASHGGWWSMPTTG